MPPDAISHGRNANPAGTIQSSALAERVGAGCLTGLCEPLGNARCKTARCRILGQAVSCDERAEFEVGLTVARWAAPRCQNADAVAVSTNTASLRWVHGVKDSISASDRWSASKTTATAFPLNAVSLKTSTTA